MLPLTPDPSPPFHGGEGRNVCFVLSKSQQHASQFMFPVARARQPEICPARHGPGSTQALQWGALQTVDLTRRREDAKANAQGLLTVGAVKGLAGSFLHH